MTSVGLRVLSTGPGVTIQDGGRRGFLRFGITESGPMDPLPTRQRTVRLPFLTIQPQSRCRSEVWS